MQSVLVQFEEEEGGVEGIRTEAGPKTLVFVIINNILTIFNVKLVKGCQLFFRTWCTVNWCPASWSALHLGLSRGPTGLTVSSIVVF